MQWQKINKAMLEIMLLTHNAEFSSSWFKLCWFLITLFKIF